MLDTSIGTLILAGGKGTRLHSSRPKVLQTLLETPLLQYVYDRFDPLCGERVWTIVGFEYEMIIQAFEERQERFILQEPQRGTGHALQVAWPVLKSKGLEYLIVANGDTPFVPPASILDLVDHARAERADVAFLSITLDDPGSYGRVVRKNDGSVRAIVEAKDFLSFDPGSEINEVNSGIYLFKMDAIAELLPLLSDDNSQKEFYITQLIDLAFSHGFRVIAVEQGDASELFGINTPQELVAAEERLRPRLVDGWIEKGVIIRNREAVRIGPHADLSPGVDITGPCEIYGDTRLAPGTRIASHCRIEDSKLNGCQVHSFTHIQNAEIGEECQVGPYARLRPGTMLDTGAKVGNFVEVKKGLLGKHSKASHLSYLGDCSIGDNVNIGAGTITCNYDGKNKHQTTIEDGVFVGSNTAIVAPVTIGEDALVGAGSVVTKNVPARSLCIARAKQKNLNR